jgi:hypothetical protein
MRLFSRQKKSAEKPKLPNIIEKTNKETSLTINAKTSLPNLLEFLDKIRLKETWVSDEELKWRATEFSIFIRDERDRKILAIAAASRYRDQKKKNEMDIIKEFDYVKRQWTAISELEKKIANNARLLTKRFQFDYNLTRMVQDWKKNAQKRILQDIDSLLWDIWDAMEKIEFAKRSRPSVWGGTIFWEQ